MIRPINDNILGKIVENQAESKENSIILLENEQNNTSNFVEIIKLGEGRYYQGEHIPFDVKIGDTAIIPTYAGTVIADDESQYIIFKEKDILAIV